MGLGASHSSQRPKRSRHLPSSPSHPEASPEQANIALVPITWTPSSSHLSTIFNCLYLCLCALRRGNMSGIESLA